MVVASLQCSTTTTVWLERKISHARTVEALTMKDCGSMPPRATSSRGRSPKALEAAFEGSIEQLCYGSPRRGDPPGRAEAGIPYVTGYRAFTHLFCAVPSEAPRARVIEDG